MFPDKYEFKRFAILADRSAVVVTHLGSSRSVVSVKLSPSSSSFSSNVSQSQTLPPIGPSLPPATSAPPQPTRAPTMPPRAPTGTTVARSVSQPISPQAQLRKLLWTAYGLTSLHYKVQVQPRHTLYRYSPYRPQHCRPYPLE
jgi:hypothetical protein